ncbi:hypothetical protein K491DRAFT_292389 [Lophiostoma macrostomum CBS 122681]|uniref:Uncharacterized protein n=1 Tax=Lophiostoma macrostomum CBS 122681 TaxID=1314788 RepID=A0A6A6SL18_9PLEO|nr:hypothetical protein K491DRAFT_292389 [Lophiostoma macrostomum CBS 122681]
MNSTSTTGTAIAANPTTWSTPVIVGAIFAILAVILGVPGAILAVMKLQSRTRARRGDVEGGNGTALDGTVQ